MIRSARSIIVFASAFLIGFAFPPRQIFTTLPESQSITENHTSESSNSLPRTNYIVRFFQYRTSKEHRSYLEENSPSKGWDWIERQNPAANFPTDFALISVDNLVADVLIEEFVELGLVKDVSADRSFRRSLLTYESEHEFIYAKKPPGKLFTSFSSSDYTFEARRHLTYQKTQVTSLFGADVLWGKGYTGAKIKMAIFDTGIRADHPHFRNIKERTNWTNEDTLNDNLGHGTFVAGVIAGQDEDCLGFAPDTEIYAFRVFTDAQVSYTSWFLDAFNYAIVTDMDVLNLSIGGPDFMDLPFVEKVWELTANNIIMVSAIGNDGPLYGTLNNPADQSDVIGVGGIDYNDQIASFSSRGMSTWELPHGYGRVKPDVVAYGRDIMGSKISSGCKSLSGTSVASPVVAGVVCLLASVLPKHKLKGVLNPASMKQALVEGATKLSGPNMFEQGAGRVDLLKSYEILREYSPRASIFPDILDHTDCPYSWPFCRQPLYASAMPLIFNATILNGMGVVGYLESPPTWHPSTDDGNLLSLLFTYSDVIWPWTGYLALHLQIKEEGASFFGEIEGNVTIQIYSPAGPGEKSVRRSRCTLRLKLKVVPIPPRRQRVIWDQFHSMKYPPGYIPRDSLDVRNDILDWHGDHLHTNFHTMFDTLRDAGYYVETLGSPLTCFDAHRYGTLLLVDPEDEYFQEEVDKLRNDVFDSGFGLAVFADWYNVDTIVKMRFFDDNTRSWWTPVTGGANIPALNDLLAPYGIAFGDKILNGDFTFDGEMTRYASGADIVKFPPGGHVHSFPLLDSSESGARKNLMLTTGIMKEDSPILGLLEMGRGRVAVYGDSNCIDSSHMVAHCFNLLLKILDFTARSIKHPVLFSDSSAHYSPLHGHHNLPSRRPHLNFSAYSSVLGKDLLCRSDSRLEVSGTKGYTLHVRGRNHRLPGYPTLDLPLQPSNNTYFIFHQDQVDVSVPIARRWLLLPVLVAVFGMMLFFAFLRIRQRKRRRRKVAG